LTALSPFKAFFAAAVAARAIRSLFFGRRARAADRAAEGVGKGEVNDSIVGPGAWFLFGILLKFF